MINCPTVQPQSMIEQQNGLMSIRNDCDIRASRNLTSMVIFQCFLYTFGMFPYLIAYILGYVLEQTANLEMFTDITYGILYVSHGSTLFVYVSFNKLFRQVLLDYLNFVAKLL